MGLNRKIVLSRIVSTVTLASIGAVFALNSANICADEGNKNDEDRSNLHGSRQPIPF